MNGAIELEISRKEVAYAKVVMLELYKLGFKKEGDKIAKLIKINNQTIAQVATKGIGWELLIEHFDKLDTAVTKARKNHKQVLHIGIKEAEERNKLIRQREGR